nr:MAG TPA: hypothetical protein [Bacteriophage sp.]
MFVDYIDLLLLINTPLHKEKLQILSKKNFQLLNHLGLLTEQTMQPFYGLLLYNKEYC